MKFTLLSLDFARPQFNRFTPRVFTISCMDNPNSVPLISTAIDPRCITLGHQNRSWSTYADKYLPQVQRHLSRFPQTPRCTCAAYDSIINPPRRVIWVQINLQIENQSTFLDVATILSSRTGYLYYLQTGGYESMHMLMLNIGALDEIHTATNTLGCKPTRDSENR